MIDLSSDETTFSYRYTRELTENGEVVRSQAWEERSPATTSGWSQHPP
jgi:hypothetical protein